MSRIAWRLSLMEMNMLPTVNVFYLSTLTSCNNQTLIYITSVASYFFSTGTEPIYVSNPLGPYVAEQRDVCPHYHMLLCYWFFLFFPSRKISYFVTVLYSFLHVFMSCTLIIVHLVTTIKRL